MILLIQSAPFIDLPACKSVICNIDWLLNITDFLNHVMQCNAYLKEI